MPVSVSATDYARMTKAQLIEELEALRRQGERQACADAAETIATGAVSDDARRFRDFAEIASDWLWETDENHRFSHFSGNYEETGLAVDERLGKTRLEATIEDTSQQKWRDHLADLAAHRRFRDFQVSGLARDGSIIHASVTGRPLFDETGAFTGYRGAATDITDKVEALNELRAAKERAEEAEAQLEEALEAMSEGFAYFDAEDRLVRCNSKHRALFPSHAAYMVPGVRFEDLLRKQVHNIRLTGAEGRKEEWIAERIKQHRNPGEPIEQEFVDGRTIRLSEYKTRSGGVVCIRTDITDLKQVEKELRDSRDRVRLITDNLPVLITYFDTDQRFRFVNKTAQDWYARPEEEFLGRKLREIGGSEAYDEVRSHLEAALLGEEQHYERNGTYPDGKTRTVEITCVPHLDKSGEVLGCFALVHDITERKRAEQALQQSEAMFRAFIDNLPNEIFIRDAQGRFVMVNRAWEKAQCKTSESVSGATIHDVFPRGRAAVYAAQDWIVQQTGKVLDEEVEFFSNDGATYFRTIKFPIPDNRGGTAAVGGIAIDITKLKRTEQALRTLNKGLEQRIEERTEELRAAQADLLRHQKLVTLGELTATVSHELRNPLAVIRTSAFLLRAGLKEDASRAWQSLDRIERNIVRCDRIIDELLDFSRIQDIELEPTPLDAWLEEILSEQTLPSDATLHSDFGMPDMTVPLDRDRFRRVVINVFDNACQAMTGKGMGDVGSEERVLTVRTQEHDGRVEVIFEDTGPGIPPDVYDSIFEPLYSTKSFGVGLGLPVVKQVMAQHGGGVEIESEEGRGTRVTLWLPR